MKKMLAVALSSLFLLSTASCNSGGEKYPFEFVGFYDTHIRQNIKIDASKDDINKILGSKTADSNGYYKYNDGFSLTYDDNGNIRRMYVYDPWGDFDADANHFELPGNINCSSTVTDFIDLYDNVYDFTPTYSSTSQVVSIFIEQTDSGYNVLSKEDMIKISKREKEHGTIYQMSIEYSSYDTISILEIEKLDYPEYGNWETALKEIK